MRYRGIRPFNNFRYKNVIFIRVHSSSSFGSECPFRGLKVFISLSCNFQAVSVGNIFARYYPIVLHFRTIIRLVLFLKFLEDTSPSCWTTDSPFQTLVTSALGFKTRVDPSRVCFRVCMQWIPQIHPCCTIC